ncbi:MAG: hypothetical protein KME27_06715 [Lyngbya sp. HA4199-MV5]|jgi:hypothetical protein|nr:hypothetical protein [Lyngbya sp. HA4199-MV5]
MLSNWLMQLSDRNPQLLREVKGHVKPRTVLVTLALSLATQLFIVGYHWRQLGNDSETIVDKLVWRIWWLDVFKTTTWVALTPLLFLGSYLLVKDIAREEQRGTLDFVRLSPGASQSVLLGKLLGVPILLYGAIALAIPLHVWSAVNAGLPLAAVMGVYLLATVAWVFVYGFALLHSLSWGAKANGLYVMPLVGIVYGVLQLLWLYWHYQCRQFIEAGAEQQYWFSLLENLDNWFLGLVSILLFALSACSVQFWCMCRHRFHHPPLRR